MKNLTKYLLLLLTSLVISLEVILLSAFFVGEAEAITKNLTPTPTPAPVYTCIIDGGTCTDVNVLCSSLGSYVWGGYKGTFCPDSKPQCCIPPPTPTPTPIPTCSSLGGNCIASGFCTGGGSAVVATGCTAGNVCCVFPPAPTPTPFPCQNQLTLKYTCVNPDDYDTLDGCPANWVSSSHNPNTTCGSTKICCWYKPPDPTPTPTPTPIACRFDSDCADGNPCTIDYCLGGLCVNNPASPETVCEKDPATFQPIKFCDASGNCAAPTPTSAPLSTPPLVWKQIAVCPIPTQESQISTPTSIPTVTPTLPPGVTRAPTPTPITPTKAPAPTSTPLPGYTDCAIRLYDEDSCKGTNSLGDRQGCRKDLEIGVCSDQPPGWSYESSKFVDCTPCNPFFIPTPTPTISPVDICRDECDRLSKRFGKTPKQTSACYQDCRDIPPIPTPTPPTPLSGSVQLTLALAQQGLTSIPVNRNRTITVVLHGADDQIVAKTGTVDYSSGTFKGTVNLGFLPSGSYKLIVKAGNFLRSPITNLVISGAAASAQITLTAGLVSDQNNDNIDAISFYANGLRTCFGSSLGIKKCDNPEDVDLNGDANVDAIDYQIYLKGIRNLRQGLPVE